jgi:SAM-dependent methyltransferase
MITGQGSSTAPHSFGIVEENRRRMLFEHIDKAGRGLEIGPYDQPTLVKSEANICFLDVQPREALVAAVPDKNQAAKIPEVDFVCVSANYREAIDVTFDYVIANHVLEHVPNPIAWLQMIAGMLVDDGVLFLSLPDKKFTFDKYRPDTPLSHVLHDYFTGVDTISREHMLETELYYDMEFIGREMRLEQRLDLERLRASYDIKLHPGVHCHVFQTETFQDKFLKPLQFLGLVPFEMVAFRGAQAHTGGEFSMVLKKRAPTTSLRPQDFFTKDYETKPPLEQAIAPTPHCNQPLRARVGQLLDRLRGRAR